MAKFRAMNWCCAKPCSAQVLVAKCIKFLQTPSNFAQILRSLEILKLYADLFGLLTFGFGPSIQEKEPSSPFRICCFCTGRDAYTQGCLHTCVLLHRDVFRKDSFLHTNLVLLHSNAFMHRCFYTGTLLHAGAFTHRCACISTHRCLYTALLLHRNAFTHQYIFFYTGILLTQSSLYTQKLLHKYSYAEMVPTLYRGVFLLTDTFSKRCFCTCFLVQRDAFTHGCF